ncbi:MAG: arginine--tRNA ligase, partial [Candidatus Obscuribacterales bacterium]|nr:arginine--tRNA ligase [Candidatus Obscuribacterales bacterium]
SPNIAKQMHVGHLRSTIIGESISRVIEFLGHKVLRVNHVGDWGTQFGMLITYLAEVCPEALTTADHIDIGDLVTFYKQAKVRFDEDEDFKTRSRQAVVKLQSGDEGSLHAWKLLCDQSRREFQEIYDTLGIENLIERGESFYNPMLEQVVEDLTKLGLLTEDQGALCVFLDEFKGKDGKIQPCIVRKTDGGFNYATTDLAALRYRVTHDKADQMIYVIDVGQSEHLKQVFTVARKAGFVPPEVEIEHIPFGLVLGEDGKKLKTRSGETIRLKELLDEAVLRARADIESRIDAEGRTETEQFKEEVSTAVGIGAVKYADLSQNRITNYMFSFDKMLALQGNTAPYMMYAYVRVQGISRKGGIDFSKLGDDAHIILNEEAEVTLAKHLLQLDEVLESVANEGMPNRLCQYLFELSQKFNVFYDNCPVLNTEESIRTSRLILCDTTARTIKLGLNLLGISVLERM